MDQIQSHTFLAFGFFKLGSLNQDTLKAYPNFCIIDKTKCCTHMPLTPEFNFPSCIKSSRYEGDSIDLN